MFAILRKGRVVQTFATSDEATRWAVERGYLMRRIVGATTKTDGLVRYSTRNRWRPGYACRWVGTTRTGMGG